MLLQSSLLLNLGHIFPNYFLKIQLNIWDARMRAAQKKKKKSKHQSRLLFPPQQLPHWPLPNPQVARAPSWADFLSATPRQSRLWHKPSTASPHDAEVSSGNPSAQLGQSQALVDRLRCQRTHMPGSLAAGKDPRSSRICVGHESLCK